MPGGDFARAPLTALLLALRTIEGASDECSLNGQHIDGVGCMCTPAWKGQNCTLLNFRPSNPDSGYRQIGSQVNRSSWGGGGWYDDAAGVWFMWVSELAGSCGMATWTSNSQTVRASAPDPLGLYTREGVQFPVWTHESEVTRGPAGEYVAFMSYHVPQTRPVCTGCVGGSTNPNCTEPLEGKRRLEDSPLISNSDPTYMSWAPASGVRDPSAWSAPALVLDAHPQMDTNFAAVVNKDGSVVAMWRDHHQSPGVKGKSTIHLARATNFKDPSTYTAEHTDVLFGDMGLENPGGVEDPFIWVDAEGHYHALFHMLYPAHPYSGGGHAFSRDGVKWTWTGQAYDGNVTFTDGTQAQYANGDRPHLLFDASGKVPVALTTAAGTDWGAPGMNTDQTFTLLRPLGVA